MTQCKSCKGLLPSAGVRPYFEEVRPSVTQNHTQVLTSTCYAAGILIKEAWQVPDVDEEIQIKLDNISNIPLGVYLYNPPYGYFRIAHWNPQNGIIGVVNDGVANTAAPGTNVPANSHFLLSPKPCCEDDTATLFPFLAESFEAPGNGLSRTIKVTSTFGLRLGELVRIGSGLYRLSLINSSKEIVITNEGAGVTPGETVEALDNSGDYQYLIVTDNTTACSGSVVEAGRLVVCDGSNERILGGSFAGQALVLSNAASETVSFEFLDTTLRICTELVNAVNITTGTQTYTITVDDSSAFLTDNLIQLNFGVTRFKITNILGNTLDITSAPAFPPANITINAGVPVCKILTTEELQNQIDALDLDFQAEIDALQLQINALSAALTSGLAAEAAARASADSTLTTNLATEASTRATADTTLQTNITAEASARASADSTLTTNLATEVTNRTNADTTLQTNITSEATTRGSADTTLQTNIDTVGNKLSAQRFSNIDEVSNYTGPTTLDANGEEAHTSEFSWLLHNDSPTLNMVAHYNLDGYIAGVLEGSSGYSATMKFCFEIGFTSGAFGTLSDPGVSAESEPQAQFTSLFVETATSRPFNRSIHKSGTIVLTPGLQIWLKARTRVEMQNKDTSDRYIVGNMQCKLSGIAVAMSVS